MKDVYPSDIYADVVESNTINTFKNGLDKHWSNQEVLYDFNADLTGTGG